jgi:hypothetical protein
MEQYSDLLLDEKSNNAIGRPISPFRKMSNIVYTFLKSDICGRWYLQNLVLDLHPIGDFSNELR